MGTEVVNFWLALLALGVAWNFLFVGGTILLTETYRPEEKAKTQALNDFLVFATVTVASLSGGVLLTSLSWRVVNLGVVPVVVVIIAAVLWLKAQRK
jgi:MFS family permease